MLITCFSIYIFIGELCFWVLHSDLYFLIIQLQALFLLPRYIKWTNHSSPALPPPFPARPLAAAPWCFQGQAFTLHTIVCDLGEVVTVAELIPYNRNIIPSKPTSTIQSQTRNYFCKSLSILFQISRANEVFFLILSHQSVCFNLPHLNTHFLEHILPPNPSFTGLS